MIKKTRAALAAALCCIASSVQAASPDVQAAAERMLGSDSETARWQNYLPFTRKLHAWGVVVESLAASTEAAGVPASAMIEALHALARAIDPARDVKAGDLFWVHYEQEYTVEGHPIGIGRVLWAELRTAAKGTVAIHRFRLGKSNAEPFWLATGQSTELTPVRLPLERISISSGFGMRADPLDQPMLRAGAMGPVRVTPARTQKAKAANTLGMGNSAADAEARAMMRRAGVVPPPGLTSKLDDRRFERLTMSSTGAFTNPAAVGASNVDVPPSFGLSTGLSPAPSPGASARAVAPRAALVMHQGIDLVAEPGTPVLAAADGVVTGAAPNGGYGNWIEIEHDGKLATVYGHLSAFAPGIAPGVRVQKDDLIGFVGNTGRSTGPHLHFELLSNGKPTNPVSHPLTKPAQLSGGNLERFRKIVARNLAEAQREGKPK
jgi:murein DD-endopeptidase MepM/ murein hydrolase activator NlpD